MCLVTVKLDCCHHIDQAHLTETKASKILRPLLFVLGLISSITAVLIYFGVIPGFSQIGMWGILDLSLSGLVVSVAAIAIRSVE